MKIKSQLNRELFVMDFVQYISAPQTQAKRHKKLMKTLSMCPENLNEVQWMKMWRGFYYAIWYSEMQKGGQEMIEEMAKHKDGSFLLSGFKSMTEVWSGIDAFRIDKYMYLVRHLLHNVLYQQIDALQDGEPLFDGNLFLKSQSPKVGVIDYIVNITSKSVGLFLHICDIFLDETVKCKNIDLDTKWETYFQLIIPFARILSTIQDDRLRNTIEKNIFDRLLNELLLNESIEIQTETLNKFAESITKIASQTESGKNRNCLYSIAEKYRSKNSMLKNRSKASIKRRIVGINPKTKKPKYELTTSVPFVRSLVPLPLL